jgi:hypothetical protein
MIYGVIPLILDPLNRNLIFFLFRYNLVSIILKIALYFKIWQHDYDTDELVTVEHELTAFNLFKHSGYYIHISRFSFRKLYVFPAESI